MQKQPKSAPTVTELNKPSPEAIQRFNQEVRRAALRIARDREREQSAAGGSS